MNRYYLTVGEVPIVRVNEKESNRYYFPTLRRVSDIWRGVQSDSAFACFLTAQVPLKNGFMRQLPPD